MLRESAKATNTEIDLKALTSEGLGDSGVTNGGLLVNFTEAVLGDAETRLVVARQQLINELGDGGLVDASAVIANYNALDRVADATGIPLEAAKEANTAELRAVLGIKAFV